jgi:hypothetical protein
MPVVPWATDSTGSGPGGRLIGASTVPLATAGTPSAMVVVYRIRQAWAPWGTPVVSGWLRSSRPGAAGRSVGGV